MSLKLFGMIYQFYESIMEEFMIEENSSLFLSVDLVEKQNINVECI